MDHTMTNNEHNREQFELSLFTATLAYTWLDCSYLWFSQMDALVIYCAREIEFRWEPRHIQRSLGYRYNTASVGTAEDWNIELFDQKVSEELFNQLLPRLLSSGVVSIITGYAAMIGGPVYVVRYNKPVSDPRQTVPRINNWSFDEPVIVPSSLGINWRSEWCWIPPKVVPADPRWYYKVLLHHHARSCSDGSVLASSERLGKICSEVAMPDPRGLLRDMLAIQREFGVKTYEPASYIFRGLLAQDQVKSALSLVDPAHYNPFTALKEAASMGKTEAVKALLDLPGLHWDVARLCWAAQPPTDEVKKVIKEKAKQCRVIMWSLTSQIWTATEDAVVKQVASEARRAALPSVWSSSERRYREWFKSL